jgi:hypothetical protein
MKKLEQNVKTLLTEQLQKYGKFQSFPPEE